MPNDRPFERLMTDLQDGDPAVAREVFDRFARRLAELAAVKLPAATRSRLDPEDVVQSVLRTFFRRHSEGEFQPEHWDALWSLLAVLAVRKCGHQIAHLLAAKRDVRRNADVGGTDSGVSAWEPTARTPSPDEAAAFEETLGQVLGGLKERERAMVVLRLEGHTIPEVAEQAKASERSVHRVLAGVRERLVALAVE
jgi:RNA polymerase sigma-70 factor (ECF subfamily)